MIGRIAWPPPAAAGLSAHLRRASAILALLATGFIQPALGYETIPNSVLLNARAGDPRVGCYVPGSIPGTVRQWVTLSAFASRAIRSVRVTVDLHHGDAASVRHETWNELNTQSLTSPQAPVRAQLVVRVSLENESGQVEEFPLDPIRVLDQNHDREQWVFARPCATPSPDVPPDHYPEVVFTDVSPQNHERLRAFLNRSRLTVAVGLPWPTGGRTTYGTLVMAALRNSAAVADFLHALPGRGTMSLETDRGEIADRWGEEAPAAAEVVTARPSPAPPPQPADDVIKPAPGVESPSKTAGRTWMSFWQDNRQVNVILSGDTGSADDLIMALYRDPSCGGAEPAAMLALPTDRSATLPGPVFARLMRRNYPGQPRIPLSDCVAGEVSGPNVKFAVAPPPPAPRGFVIVAPSPQIGMQARPIGDALKLWINAARPPGADYPPISLFKAREDGSIEPMFFGEYRRTDRLTAGAFRAIDALGSYPNAGTLLPALAELSLNTPESEFGWIVLIGEIPNDARQIQTAFASFVERRVPVVLLSPAGCRSFDHAFAGTDRGRPHCETLPASGGHAAVRDRVLAVVNGFMRREAVR
ncbi:MAG: hypothetical protein ACJ8AW_34445 [Rhodopila sp.]